MATDCKNCQVADENKKSLGRVATAMMYLAWIAYFGPSLYYL